MKGVLDTISNEEKFLKVLLESDLGGVLGSYGTNKRLVTSSGILSPSQTSTNR